jgi:hypothetical protein
MIERPAASAASMPLKSTPEPSRSVAPTPTTTMPAVQRDKAPPIAPGDPGFKDALLAEVRRGKAVFYNTVVAQAQRIEVTADRVTFSFLPNQRALRDAFEQNRAWLDGLAQQVAGRRITCACVQTEAAATPPSAAAASDIRVTNTASAAPVEHNEVLDDAKKALRDRALADAGVQALLEVFPAEIRDVEEI